MNMIKSNITVIDSMCGTGKTSYAIQKINENPNKSYVYVTPFLDEVERLQKAAKVKFYAPAYERGRKLHGFNTLLCNGHNIATTHSTFSNATDDTIEYIKQGNYTLILDEVIDVVTEYNDIANGISQKVKKKDIELLFDKRLIDTDKYGYVEWIGESYEGGSFSEIERLAKRRNLLLINNTLFLWEFPVDVFKAFNDVMILTYIFDGTVLKSFFEYHDIPYILRGVESYIDENNNQKYQVSKYKNDFKEREEFKKLIDICQDEKLNDYGYSAFTSTWFKTNIGKNRNALAADTLRKNLYNFFRNKQNSKAADVMWTCYENSKNAVSPVGYTKIPSSQTKTEKESFCFVPCNARATNEYKERHVLAYLCNMWINPYIEKFFAYKNIEIDKEAFALNCLVQWVWRSRIRDGGKIQLYLPSSRMRNIFEKWLSETS